MKMKKSLTCCTKAASYIKVKTATALPTRSEAASEPSTSSESESECNSRKNTYLSAALVSVLQTGKSSNLKRSLDRYFDSINQTENTQLDELLARTTFCSWIASVAC
jgi:thiamine biosynthesis lipoprotein ApbE